MAIPATDYVRPVKELLEQARDACISAGVPAQIYTGTTYQGLASVIPSLLVQSKGEPVGVVCYGGSTYGNKPRRLSVISILVLQGHTRVSSGTLDAIEAAEKIIAGLDDQIYQETAGEWPITDHWRIASDEVIDIEGLDAAACILVNFNVEDY
ncbi:MAG: hypothetical protein BWY07_02639 [Candidatus Hydrogenedentes bacterium ADurb.Bin170]|nr:MAG: hypothetical protein BWY07_02639 [Candidatus Hydrogenedentes bacterium ADurb.Bin170]